MSLSSTSSSKWARLRRDVLRLIGIWLLLEVTARVDPVRSLLATKLDPYENLLWYSDLLPAYHDQLLNGPHYDVWMIGSSYMMTSLDPAQIQDEMQAAGFEGMTFQNYGMTNMRNLTEMAAVFDRWMLQLDQPDRVVIAIAEQNFLNNAELPGRIFGSPMENMLIFPDTVDDYVARFLYNTSAVFRYGVISRNAVLLPPESASLKSYPSGGWTPYEETYEPCDFSVFRPPPFKDAAFQAGIERFDQLVAVFQKRDIPILVVNIPLSACGLHRFYPTFQDYQRQYLQPIAAHVETLGLPFFELDTRFYAEVPEVEQHLLFRNLTHPNQIAAEMFSSWTADFIATQFQDAG
ncbi:MAG: hypothetical protein K8L97_18120 [Anaerolineae bacterium]|nr:hypothetical protein [Anaerolineae bacterium]